MGWGKRVGRREERVRDGDGAGEGGGGGGREKGSKERREKFNEERDGGEHSDSYSVCADKHDDHYLSYYCYIHVLTVAMTSPFSA